MQTLKGADVAGLRRMISTHAGPNPPVKPLPADAEKAKEEGNVGLHHSRTSSVPDHLPAFPQAFFKAGAYGDAVKSYSKALESAVSSCSILFQCYPRLRSPRSRPA